MNLSGQVVGEAARPVQTFQVVQVSEKAHLLITDAVRTASATGAAAVEDMNFAYGEMNKSLRLLYSYIGALEKARKVARPIVKRF